VQDFALARLVRAPHRDLLRCGVRSLIVAKFVPGLSTIAPALAGGGLLELHRAPRERDLGACEEAVRQDPTASQTLSIVSTPLGCGDHGPVVKITASATRGMRGTVRNRWGASDNLRVFSAWPGGTSQHATASARSGIARLTSRSPWCVKIVRRRDAMLRGCSGHRDAAVAAVGTSTVGTLLLDDPTIRATLFFPAILLSTSFGGTGPD
jgi:hypothetical protein